MQRAVTLALLSVILTTAAVAAPSGLPTDRFVAQWTAAPSLRFEASAAAPSQDVTAMPAPIPDGALADALAAGHDDAIRRGLVIAALEAPLTPAQKTALEDLREAQRRFANEGDAAARDTRFVALLKQVTEGSGRSATRDAGGEDALSTAYDHAIRNAGDGALPRLEEAEANWTRYRDAFGRFALSLDRPDAAALVRDDLARARADDLQRLTSD